MPIEFRCPDCQKLLRVPDESAGAKAKCPQCGTIADVPSSEPLGAGSPVVGDTNKETQSGQPAPKPLGDESINPYSAPTSGHESISPKPVLAGEIVPTAVDFGSIFNYAFEVMKANAGLMIGITLIAGGISVVLSGIQNQFSDQGAPGVASIVAIIKFLIDTFFGIGITQICFKLLRRQPAEFGDLFGGGPLYFRMLGASIINTFAVLFGTVPCIVLGLVWFIFFWPFQGLIVDERAKALESFGMALPITKLNVGTTILLMLASIGIMLAGFIACLVGLLFAGPLVGLMWTAAYLMMTGQIVTKSEY